MFAVGLTLMLDPEAPVLQLYVLAPAAVKVVLFPVQILEGAADAVTVGRGFTVTVTFVLAVCPAASTVTVYVVVVVGLTTILEPVPPVLQVYVEPPSPATAFNVADSPSHIVDGVAVAVTEFEDTIVQQHCDKTIPEPVVDPV